MNLEFIHFAKRDNDAIIPSKRIEDAGYDIYSLFTEDEILLNPGEIKLIPTGISSAFSSSLVLVVKERSSTGAIGLAVRMGVIDSGYRGEIKIALNNTSKLPIVITKRVDTVVKTETIVKYPYAKAIAQLVFCQIPSLLATEVTIEELTSISSQRGENFLGASGK